MLHYIQTARTELHVRGIPMDQPFGVSKLAHQGSDRLIEESDNITFASFEMRWAPSWRNRRCFPAFPQGFGLRKRKPERTLWTGGFTLVSPWFPFGRELHSFGCGSKFNSWGYAGFSHCLSFWFHLPRCHFGTGFLSHSHLVSCGFMPPKANRCPFWLVCSKNRWVSLVYLV